MAGTAGDAGDGEGDDDHSLSTVSGFLDILIQAGFTRCNNHRKIRFAGKRNRHSFDLRSGRDTEPARNKMHQWYFAYLASFTNGQAMRKKLTISLDAAVYDALSALVGRGGISKFIEHLVRPHVLGGQLDAGYRAMAADAAREREAGEWIAELADVRGNEAR